MDEGLLEVDQNHIVSIVITINNLSSLDIEQQVEKTIEMTINLAKDIAPLFFDARSITAAIAAAIIAAGPAAPAAAAELAGVASAVSGVLSQEADRIIDNVVGPILRTIVGFAEGLFGDEPVCDGVVLKNTLVIPGQDFQRLRMVSNFHSLLRGRKIIKDAVKRRRRQSLIHLFLRR